MTVARRGIVQCTSFSTANEYPCSCAADVQREPARPPVERARLLDGAVQARALAPRLRHHRHVIEPVKVGQRLLIVLVLDELLRPAVQQPDVRVGARDVLSLQLKHQPEHAVRCRVLRGEAGRVSAALTRGSQIAARLRAKVQSEVLDLCLLVRYQIALHKRELLRLCKRCGRRPGERLRGEPSRAHGAPSDNLRQRPSHLCSPHCGVHGSVS